MVLLIIKIVIALALICLLRIMIWQESKTSLFHSHLQLEFGSDAVGAINNFALLLMGIAVIITVFSFPNNGFGFITAGILGLIGALMGM